MKHSKVRASVQSKSLRRIKTKTESSKTSISYLQQRRMQHPWKYKEIEI